MDNHGIDHLERRLAAALRRAHWPMTGGDPVCPRCYDGEHLKIDRKSLSQVYPACRKYFCRACEYRFSDLVGTPLEHSWVPLKLWATVALAVAEGRPVRALPGVDEIGRKYRRRLVAAEERLKASNMAQAWAAELRRIGFKGGRVVVSREARRTA
ncbi:hypothetical protein [Candidatus Nitrospira bockiana]